MIRIIRINMNDEIEGPRPRDGSIEIKWNKDDTIEDDSDINHDQLWCDEDNYDDTVSYIWYN